MIPEIPVNGLTLILGGARSGKSSFAEKIAHDSGKSVLYIATATAGDDEMAERIRNHQASRPAQWQTLECPLNVGRRLDVPRGEVVIVDCITLLVSNILFSFPEDTPAETVMHKVRVEMEDLIGAQSRIGGQWLVVSNEVGLGLVPPYPQGRIYRDVLGRANQILAQAASRVILMVAGIPMVVK
ncbi:MAG TPA: bifunctional adenosylcobinamide kinase/adenosylcobinamide-phosphate guanylyltransferase [Smithellaceae bacterium]|jgi:adenosylcobinamide kinase / adenosylcobinamide-phosphate guanylyltransferase|nr:bifunctional adenosylcobinamide kinase/adenosylcobinamide-phosphate guanylyltransferase [Smithellaceae bacterium]